MFFSGPSIFRLFLPSSVGIHKWPLHDERHFQQISSGCRGKMNREKKKRGKLTALNRIIYGAREARPELFLTPI
ncbi:hypothetical protein TNCV_4955221 [Trichonephila clavipes]|nr:hypothetical protein TNCV_4955221 [Trichonephila clavipes]